MSKIFNKDGTFKNQNRHRVRFYSKIFKKYYSVWIYHNEGSGSIITTKNSDLMLSDTLIHKRMYGGKMNAVVVPELIEYTWEVIIP